MVSEIEKELSPYTDQILRLESEKKGSNKHDKKLNHRIKNVQDKIKEDLKILNEKKKDYEKSIAEFKEVQRKIEVINNKIEELDF